MRQVLFVTLLVVGVVFQVSAHNYLPPPSVPGATTHIPNIIDSRAAYRELTPSYPIDRYEFQAKRGEPIYVQMTIPHIARLKTFDPSFALIVKSASWNAAVPSLLERGTFSVDDPSVRALLHLSSVQHALTVEGNGSPPRAFHEPFTDTNYRLKQTIRIPAPVTGTYEIAVFDRAGATGKYVLATGEKERFTLKEIFHLPKVRKIVRKFMEAQ